MLLNVFLAVAFRSFRHSQENAIADKTVKKTVKKQLKSQKTVKKI